MPLSECHTQKGMLCSRHQHKYHGERCSEALPNRTYQRWQVYDIEIANAHPSILPVSLEVSLKDHLAGL